MWQIYQTAFHVQNTKIESFFRNFVFSKKKYLIHPNFTRFLTKGTGPRKKSLHTGVYFNHIPSIIEAEFQPYQMVFKH